MPELKDRIEAIMSELHKAIAQRWTVPLRGSYEIDTKIDRGIVSEPTAPYTISPDVFTWQKSTGPFRGKHVSKPLSKHLKSHSKSGDKPHFVMFYRGDGNLRTEVKFKDVSDNEIDLIMHTADRRVKIAETKIGHLVNHLWLSKEDDIDQSYDDIHDLYQVLQQYIILDDAWRDKNNINRESDEIKKLKLFKNKIENFQVVYIAAKEEKEIPDDVYELMSVEEKINSFVLMHDNWDGEGAEAVTKTAAKNALHFLKQYPHVEPCFVCATYEGKVGIDFKKGNLRLETQIISSERMKCLIIEDGKKIIHNEIIPQSDFPKLLTLLKF